MPAEVPQHVAERIFDKIEALRLELGGKIDGIGTHFAEESAKCEICRPIVLGNGQKPISDRVGRIEGVVGRLRWALTAIIAPLFVYGCYALLEKWLGIR